MDKVIKGIDIKEISISRIFSAAIRRMLTVPHIISFYLPFGFPKRNRMRLSKFKDIHKGKRCFIIANGPSLKDIDFNLLKDEITIGMNRIYLLDKQIGFMPTYLVVFDIPIQLKQFTSEYENVAIPKFYPWRSRHLFQKKENINFYQAMFSRKFQPDFTKRIGNARSVTVVCVQLAYYMGFDEVILIGKDHSYNVQGMGGGTVIADGKEQNHFISGYYKQGQKWKMRVIVKKNVLTLCKAYIK